MLSESSRIYDPMGWLAPTVVVSKILFQKLWLSKVDWDDNLPEEIDEKWQKWRNECEQLANIKIPRYIENYSQPDLEFHCFSDASEMAYSAVIYARCKNSRGEFETYLVTSKTRVAPMKQISLPRLELCGASLLAKLFKSVASALSITSNPKIYAWTDSSTVLAWLSDHPRRWKCFIGNRTSEILQILPRKHWFYCKSKENPADCASRGVYPSQLIGNKLWWHGPQWLKTDNIPHQECTIDNEQVHKEERENMVKLLEIEHNDDTVLQRLISRCSTWSKMIRVLGYMKRFIHYLSAKSQNRARNTGPLTTKELGESSTQIISWVQQEEFMNEIKMIKKGNQLVSAKFKALSPFLDKEGLLRVGGRLQNSIGSFQAKHPLILPSRHPVSLRIIKYYHLKFLHPGSSLLSSLLKLKYWLIGGRSIIRKMVNQCIICTRHKGKTRTQLMGQMPESRLSPLKVFYNVGVDFAGPLSILDHRRRGSKTTKGYLSVFVCMITKAVHLEVVSSLSTEAFIACLRRFIARRGRPKYIYSDNGSNFIGAKRRLSEMEKITKSKDHNNEVAEYLATESITWHLIPPFSPNFGGLWESAVKSVKHHLLRAIGNSNFTFEEIQTLLCQIEAILNSRPLWPISESDTVDDVLTPGHFLIGKSLVAAPDDDIEGTADNRLHQWQRIQKQVKIFWKKYQIEYLHTIQQRRKWTIQEDNLKINDVVIVRDKNLPPCSWLLGKIVELHPGKDNIVRVVTIKTSNSTIKRPITVIIKLPIEHNPTQQ